MRRSLYVFQQGAVFFTALMLVYLVMVIFGWLKWQQEYQDNNMHPKLPDILTQWPNWDCAKANQCHTYLRAQGVG